MNMINVTKMTFVFFGILFSAIIFSYVDSTVLKVLLLTAIFFYLHSWMISNDTSNSGLKKLNKKNCIFNKSISTKSNCNKSTCTTTDKCGEYVYDRNGKKRYICTSVNYFHDSNNNLLDNLTCSNNNEYNNNQDNTQEEQVNTSSSSDDNKSDISDTSTSDNDSNTSTVIDESGSDSCNTSLTDDVQDNEDNITEKKEDEKEEKKEDKHIDQKKEENVEQNKKEKILNESTVSDESLFELFDQ